MKDVDAEYYGYRDEDDGMLLPLEAQYEKQGVAKDDDGATAAAIEAIQVYLPVCVCVCLYAALQEAVQKWRAEKEARLSGNKSLEEVQPEEEEQSIYSAHKEQVSPTH